MRDKLFYAICFGFILGVLLRSFIYVNLYVILFVSFLALIIFLFFTVISRYNWGIVFSIFIFAITLGMWRFHGSDVPAPKVFEDKVGQEFTWKGILINEPDSREENQKLNIKIEHEDEEVEVFVTTSLGTEFIYGDELEIVGELKKPENFETDTGKTFDYINYLRKDDIYYVMSYPKVEVLSHGYGNFVQAILFKVKNAFLGGINGVVAPPESTLMGGLILGERSSLESELRQKFIDTGTIHIVALSGYNVTIVAEWFMKLFSFF